MNIKLVVAVAILFVVLSIAQIIVCLVKRRHPEQNWAELSLRMRTWWVVGLIFILAIVSSKTVSLVLIGFVSFLALKEFFTIVPMRLSDNTPILCAYLCIPVQYYWVGSQWFAMFVVFVPIYLFLLLPMIMVMIGDTKGFLNSATTLHWGVMATVFAVSHIAYLNMLDYQGQHIGPQLVVYLFVLTECNDIAQYLWGKLFGTRKILTRITQNKTLEGFVGGVISTIILAAVLAPVLTPLTFWPSVCIGILIGIFGLVGDLVLSAIKLDVGIKDAVRLLPGHGGILARLNSLIYTAPILFHFIHYLYYQNA